MPASHYAEVRIGTVAHSECAMHCRLAGLELLMIEEDLFMNGKGIVAAERRGCYVRPENGGRVPMLKSEAGWRDARIATAEDIARLTERVPA